jgi:hypothetical protein
VWFVSYITVTFLCMLHLPLTSFVLHHLHRVPQMRMSAGVCSLLSDNVHTTSVRCQCEFADVLDRHDIETESVYSVGRVYED